MMKAVRFWSLLLILAAVAACAPKKSAEGPDMAFAPFIKAYSGGMVAESGTVRVELNQAVPFDRQSEDLFSFSPSVKGVTRWISPSSVEFVPDEGIFKGGNTYQCRFALGKALGLDDKKLATFRFPVKIAPKQVAISVDGIRIEREGEAIVTGVLHLSEPLEPEVLSKAFKADIGGVKVDLALSDGSTSIPFSTETIYMGQDEKILNLKIQGEGLAERKPVKVTIPAEGPFRVLDIRRVPGPDTAVEVFFSEPLSSNAALKGLIELQGSQRQQVDIDANIARVTYESATINMQLLISGNVRSSGGSSLGGGYSTRLPSSEIKPAVEIPLKGNILPDRKQLLLPLKAVNLSAVDIKVIQIFEDNMPMFLQDNDFSGSSDIRRSGRLVYSRQLRLDGDPSRDLHQWNEYGIDLTNLFKREPGALYRIRVSFKQEYSLYGKDIIP